MASQTTPLKRKIRENLGHQPTEASLTELKTLHRVLHSIQPHIRPIHCPIRGGGKHKRTPTDPSEEKYKRWITEAGTMD